MNIVQPIYLFLNELLVDEVWISVKRDGIPAERVRDATAKMSATVKFGLGHLWTWLASDLAIEATPELAGSQSNKVLFTPFLRALLLPELLPDTVTASSLAVEDLEGLSIGTFLDVECDQSLLIQIPTLSDYYRAMILSQDSGESDKQELIAQFEKLTAARKAFALIHLLEDDQEDKPSFFAPIFNELLGEFTNAMAMSNDDQNLLISQLKGRSDTLVMSFLEEKYVRRNLAGYTGQRPVRVFGKLASRRKGSDDTGLIIGVEAISIALA